jgi:hypothetical protein
MNDKNISKYLKICWVATNLKWVMTYYTVFLLGVTS